MRKTTKKDKLEPAVRISRKCFACGELFILSHPNSPVQLCEECTKALSEIIMERRSAEKNF